ncbi:O-antigen ligase family protein [Tepidibacillus sp. LV47]|uniref:O-antigen ligase family protein n=1 Tax=Tepidibacillus sp. LV47 TaxID=3398228 RepID=UPI003AABC34C
MLRNVWTIGLFLLFIWSSFVSLINSQILSLFASLGILAFLIVSIYVQENYRTEEMMMKVLHSIFIISIGSAFIGVLEALKVINYDPAWWKFLFGTRQLGSIDVKRISGTFNNPNLAGTWYAIMTLIGFYFFNKNEGRKKWFYAIATLLYLIVLFWTGSRGGTIGLIIGFATYFYFLGHKKKVITILVLFLSGTILMLHHPQWFPRGNSLFATIDGRVSIWENAVYLFVIKPVTGWGLMGIYTSNNYVFNKYHAFHAHNIPLTIATTLGLIGLAIFIWMIWELFKEIKVLYRFKNQLTPLLAAIQAAILGQGLFDFTIMSPQVGILFVASATMIETLAYSYQPSLVPYYFAIRLKQKKQQKSIV